AGWSAQFMSLGAKKQLDLSMPGENVNAAALNTEIAWFTAVLKIRFDRHFGRDTGDEDIDAVPPPDLMHDQSEFARIVREFDMRLDERLIIILALLPHLQSHALDSFLLNNKDLARGFTEFGGWKGKQHSGFLPTCETAVFIL